MAENVFSRLRKSWKLFANGSKRYLNDDLGPSYAINRSSYALSYASLKTDLASIYTKIALDVSALSFRHVRVDENGNYLENIDSDLNRCLSLQANIDEAATAFIFNIVMSLCDEGFIDICPMITDHDPEDGSYKIYSLRVGKIVDSYPKHVKVNIYDEERGDKFDIIVPKSYGAVVENPLRAVMNEPNSTLSRLVHKLSLIDTIDDDNASGRLNLLLQYPYRVQGEMKTAEAERRVQKLEDQLVKSKYGIGYIDATEKVTQLSRPIENKLVEQVNTLTTKLYSQLGMTESVFNGTASENELLNYYNKTVVPIATAICESMTNAFLTPTAISQGQRIRYFRDIFKTTVLANIAEIADKFTRNEILSSNEVRSVIGYKPVDSEAANELRNKNVRAPSDSSEQVAVVTTTEGENSQNEEKEV